MPHMSPDPVARWSAHIQDVLASDSSIREGLQDDDAIPLMDWGRAQAERVAARMVAQSPDVDEETANAKARTLARLMTVISRAVVYRHKQGADWLVKVFRRLNKESEKVFGEDAPVLSDEAIDAWIAAHPEHSDGELLRDLLARFSPPDSTPGPPDQAGPVTPLSDAVDLPDWSPPTLPGRSGASPDAGDETPSSHTGDKHDQT